MRYPVVKVETVDGCINHGLFIESENSKQIYIHIHGTAGNFYDDDFVETMSNIFVRIGISFLSTNNRGSGVYDIYSRKGSAVEIFEDCLFDIDAWIEFAIKKGYTEIFLSGHSLGVEKIVYYMENGSYKDKIGKIVLLSPADSPRWRIYDKNYKFSQKERDSLDKMIQEAETLISEGRKNILMDIDIENGFMPRTPYSLLNILGEDTELIKTLPFHTGRLDIFRNIIIPICVVIGNQKEYTGISPEDALDLMKRENILADTYLIEEADHVFTDCEDKLLEIIKNFISK